MRVHVFPLLSYIFRILNVLENEELYIKQISEKAGISTAGVIRYCQYLEEKQCLVSRVVFDRRVMKYYRITEKGRKLLSLLREVYRLLGEE